MYYLNCVLLEYIKKLYYKLHASRDQKNYD